MSAAAVSLGTGQCGVCVRGDGDILAVRDACSAHGFAFPAHHPSSSILTHELWSALIQHHGIPPSTGPDQGTRIAVREAEPSVRVQGIAYSHHIPGSGWVEWLLRTQAWSEPGDTALKRWGSLPWDAECVLNPRPLWDAGSPAARTRGLRRQGVDVAVVSSPTTPSNKLAEILLPVLETLSSSDWKGFVFK